MAKEEEEYGDYVNRASSSEELLRYPNNQRFHKLNEPLVYSDPFCYNNYKQKIWSQIPFAGTLIISIRNVSKENCLDRNGFEPSDIDNLIELAKEGRVQFGLQTDVRLYEGLDYLDPIFAGIAAGLFNNNKEVPSTLEKFKDFDDSHFRYLYVERLDNTQNEDGVAIVISEKP